MNRKLMVFAVAGTFAPVMAFAQGTSVIIYGTMNGAWNYVEAKGASSQATLAAAGTGLTAGANLPSRSRVDVDSSNIGFRVKEDLGGGLGAWGQCEITMSFDSGGGSVCTRNAGVGLEGAFGNVFLGQWDTPMKGTFGTLDVMGNTHIVVWTGVMTQPGLNSASGTFGNGAQATAITTTVTNNGAQLSFDRRQQNTVNYYTPKWAGFQGKFQYSANEEKPADPLPGTTNPATLAAAGLDPRMYSFTLQYDNGPFFVAAGYEQHDDFNSAILNPVSATNALSSSDDDAWRVGGGFKFGNFRVTAMYEELSYESTTTSNVGVVASGTVERDAFYVGASWAAAPHYAALSYAVADDWDCGGTAAIGAAARCANTGGKSFAAKYAYSLSKRTELFAHYVKIKNDQNAQYTFGTNPLNVTAPGADPEGFGVGVKHTF